MTTKLKLYVGRKLADGLYKSSSVTANHIKSLLQVENKPNDSLELGLSVQTLETSKVDELLKIKPDDIIESIQQKDQKVCFRINKNIFLKEIIEYAAKSDENPEPKKIVIEFSSPNVAKPFHVGHLRSTIIGNFIANLNEYLQNNVVRLNYLGDWGTQFGMIKVGVQELQRTDEEIKTNPLKTLFESYVHANNLATKDPTILERAKREFNKLENGSHEDIDSWKKYMSYTISELDSIYSRLGVRFNEYYYESMYKAKDIKNVVDTLKHKNILTTLNDGKQVAKVNDRDVSVIKSDGSTLYISRDIAAALHRYEKYKFDRMYYVVDNGQADHFVNLKEILNQMSVDWVDKIGHVKFGRIHGMSTRKGNVVFLKDILDETRDLMVKKQLESPTTKALISDSNTSDILGISCVIVNDLKQRRQKDYEFSWDKALQVKGDSGVKLQYTHCRLCNLEKFCGVAPAKECIPELLTAPEIISLVREMAKFHEVLHKSEVQLEACLLVTYLFQLCNYINKALKVVRVKNEDEVLAGQRLLVFNNARRVLAQGMKILGLHPLEEM